MSWLVCKSDALEEMKSLLGATNLAEGQRPSFCVTLSPAGRAFIFESKWRNWTFDRDEQRRRLSLGREVYFFMLEEHVMASEAALWRDGQEIWRVQHESEQDIYHLDARGQLPPSFETHKRKRFDEQEREGADCGADYFISIPMDLAAECTGYDGDFQEPEGEYFEWACAPKNGLGGLLARLFGR